LNLKEQIPQTDFESKTGLSTSLSKGHSHPIDACPVHQSLSLKPTGLCVVFWSDERRFVSSKKGQSVVPFAQGQGSLSLKAESSDQSEAYHP